MTASSGKVKAETPAIRKKNVERERLLAWLTDRIKASRKEPSAEVVALTPALAELLLEHNPVNRPISSRNAHDIGADIASGRFEFNGESIVVSRAGILLDGQHRCQQVVATGRAIQTVIVFGPREEARFTIDTGKSKTVSNFLAMKGRLYTHVLAAVANYFLQWKEGGAILHGGGRLQTPTKQQILAAADEMPGVDESVLATAPSMKTVKSHAVLAFCHYAIWKRSSRELADAFMLKIIEGDGLRKGDPILVARNTLLRMNRGTTANDRVELIFRAWNAHRLGSSVDRIRLSGKLLPKLER